MANDTNSRNFKPYSNLTPKEKRNFWFRRIKSNHDFILKQYEQEIKHYLKFFAHQFQDLLPEALLKSDRVDVNVVYPIIKSLIPKLYFQDPKVYLKALQKEIVVPQTVSEVDEQGQEIERPILDPMTGQPQVDIYDGPHAARIIGSQINYNIREAELKKHTKSVIYDAHLGYYGVIKTGFGNEQGTYGMGDGAPISAREDTNDGLAYGIRLKPWNVVPDLDDFYNQKWTAVYYCVHPMQLISDERLQHTEKIKGTAELNRETQKERGTYLDKEDTVLTEYYEVYVKPSAEYPDGLFLILSCEVEDDFLYASDWPYSGVKRNPIKFLYFNPDPRGGLPIPDVRYYAAQQKAKSTTRRIANEYVMRSLPFVGVDLSGVKDQALLTKALQSGMTPKFVVTNGRNPNTIFGAFNHPNLSADFYKFDSQIDDDISRTVGMVKGVYPGSGSNIELASVAKIADSGEAIRENERADIVKDFVTSILYQWVGYYQEFAGYNNSTLIEGDEFPTKWTVDQIRCNMSLDVQAFSMSYEDPAIRRRQWADLINLASGPATQAALQSQGAQLDFVKMWKRVLETFDERDVETFLLTDDQKPENQVMNAINEGQQIAQGMMHVIKPTDNHKLHILIHNEQLKLGIDTTNAITQHQQALLQKVPGTPGGGNVEGLPLNGVAADQELFSQPLEASMSNEVVANEREANKTY